MPKTLHNKIKRESWSFNAPQNEAEERESESPLISPIASPVVNRTVSLNTANILRLQQTVGNRAVQRMLSQGRANSPVSVQRQTAPRTTIQRTLTKDSKEAFEVAGTYNPEYKEYQKVVDGFAETSEQNKLNDIKTAGQKLKSLVNKNGRRDELTKFVRAYILKEFALRASKVNEITDKKAYKKKRGVYLSKGVETRDKFAPLLTMGPKSPEALAFMETEGFAGGVDVAPDEVKKGPKIDVRSTFIGGKVMGIRLRAHLFIVYTSSEGKQLYMRGGPSKSEVDDKGNVDLGNTQTDVGYYTPGTVDWDPSAPSETVMKGPEAAEKVEDMMNAAQIINSMEVPYIASGGGTKFLEGENCNAAAYTILNKSGIPTKKPSGVHPGWGKPLGTFSGKGKRYQVPLDPSLRAYTLNGGEGDTIDVFKDQTQMEKATQLPGGKAVRAYINDLATIDNYSSIKIKFDGEKTGYINPKQHKLDVTAIPGRNFQISGTSFRITEVYTLDHKRTGVFLNGESPVDVLDADFEPGEDAWNSKLVKIRYNGDQLGVLFGRDIQPIGVDEKDEEDHKEVGLGQGRKFKVAHELPAMVYSREGDTLDPGDPIEVLDAEYTGHKDQEYDYFKVHYHGQTIHLLGGDIAPL